MRKIYESLLLINENGEVFRKSIPFWIILKDDFPNRTKLLVKRLIFEDDNIILYEIDDKPIHHSKCEIIHEDKVAYAKLNNFVYLFL